MNDYSNEFLLNLYRMMLKIRLCEESLVDPIRKGEVKCPVHLYSGEEAVATGVCAALSESDYVFGNHRSHGHYLAKGGDLNSLIAEIYGKETGCARGRGGSMQSGARRAGGGLRDHGRPESPGGRRTIFMPIEFVSATGLPICLDHCC